MSSAPSTSFQAHYKALIASGAIEADPAQARAAKLAALEQRLAAAAGPQAGPAGPAVRRQGRGAAAGLYIHGEVGRGKTMLMDLFFEQSPVRTSAARISTISWPTCRSASRLPAEPRAARSPMAT